MQMHCAVLMSSISVHFVSHHAIKYESESDRYMSWSSGFPTRSDQGFFWPFRDFLVPMKLEKKLCDFGKKYDGFANK